MKNLFPKINLNDYRETEIDLSLSAFEVFSRLYPHCGNIFLLESLSEEGAYNRYSYIGFDPVFVVSAKNQNLFLDKKVHKSAEPYKLLGSLADSTFNKPAVHGYCGGLVGYFSYESAKYFEPAFVGYKNPGFPDFEFGFYADGLRFDKKTKKCVYFYFSKPPHLSNRRGGKPRIENFIKLLKKSSTPQKFSFQKIGVNKSQKEHKKMILSAKKHIFAGDIFQAVLSIKTFYRLSGDKTKLYAALRQINPSPYMFYFKFGQREIITASPELLIRVKGAQIEHFGTLAGTISAGKNKREDEKLAQKLISDEKERAEHMMLVDLARNDVGRLCEFGSVKVNNIAKVKKYNYVQHLYTEIRGRLRKKENPFSALAACFPAGTLSGAPKIEAMKIISRLEGEPRGPYGGVGGYFSLNNDSMLAITIRSIFIKGDNAYTQTGSGIVADSKPEKEYQEILNKQKAMEMALLRAEKI